MTLSDLGWQPTGRQVGKIMPVRGNTVGIVYIKEGGSVWLCMALDDTIDGETFDVEIKSIQDILKASTKLMLRNKAP